MEASTLARPWISFDERDATFVYGIAFWLALIQVSIAASQIVLGVLVLVWIYRVWRGALTVRALPVDRPFALYAGLSLLAAAFSFDPVVSLQASKKLVLLVVPYMLVSGVRKKASIESLVVVLIAMADIGALVGLWQYRFGEIGDLNHRIHGFMGHYMTYSGLLMGAGILALAQLLFGGRHYRWFHLASLALIGSALSLSLTRSAWIGMLVATVVLAFIRDKRLVLLVPVVAVAVVLVLPREVERRVGSFLTPDASGVDRVYMIEAGMDMIGNHPWLGVGPNMVSEVYPIYVARDAPRRDNPHLHNNVLQIAAERGVPTLAAWLWILVVASISSTRALRGATDAPGRALAAGSLGVLVAGIFAGMFEYNFGDSEFQMMFLFAITIPWILERVEASS